MKYAIAAIVLGVSSFQAAAQLTPVGLWRTIDDKTGAPKAEIRIRESAEGVLTGVIERPLVTHAVPTCDQCTDDRKGKPKLGMEVVRDLKKVEGQDVWEGGNILDPDNGKIYTLRMTPQDGGSKLQVRGYIGPFYRTQTWVRVQ